MNTFTRMLCAAVAVLCGACGPKSVRPIAPPSMTGNDPALEGTWRSRDKTETTFYHVHHSEKQKPGWMDVVQVEVPKDADALEHGALELATARIAGVRYLSAREKGPKAAKTFDFLRYEIDWRGRLKLWTADDELLTEAVRTGKLRGKITKRKQHTDVLITDTSERIAAWVAGQDPKKAFGGDASVLEKVR